MNYNVTLIGTLNATQFNSRCCVDWVTT